MKIPVIIKYLLLSVLMISAVNAGQPVNLFSQTDKQREIGRIKPWTENESYWQFKGKPVMLIGGTDQDNLFNHPEIGPAGLEAHLDLLVSAGGNYVRNTMSSRDRTDTTSIYFNNDNLYPFYRDPESGLFDMNRFNSEYWERFRRFLDMTAERDIIVQIEIWDRWDYSGDRQPHYMAYGWSAQPFNPKNNINYTAEETNLNEEKWEGHPIFRTIPELDSVPVVLAYQESLVEKILSFTLEYDHILYCISNESTSAEEWSRYWALFVLERARKAGVNVEVTEMWNHWDLTNQMHGRTFKHPDIYSFVDISQNNHQTGQTHWDNMLAARELLHSRIRPMNNIKIYGGDVHGGGIEEGIQKFWRNIFAGCASSRFHRPGREQGYYGAGLNGPARIQLRSARLFLEAFDIFRATPDRYSSLLSNRDENEAYLSYIPGRKFAVYFPGAGSVDLDTEGIDGPFVLRWLDITAGQWLAPVLLPDSPDLNISTPGTGQWVALIYPALTDSAVQPYRNNPWYWEYKGEPIMLVGASDRDNLWQWTGERLIEHLDLIKSVGGNYVRNTMSDRNEGDTFAPKEIEDGLYDLNQWNEAYWDKLKFFLDETEKRGIIVHLTLWDWFDLSGDDVYGRFAIHPLNPENNITWKTGTIRNAWDYYGGSLATGNKPVLEYQHRYIDRLISISSGYGHIFYNIANESGRATVHLDPWMHAERVSVKWLDIASLRWSDEEIIEPQWDNYDGTDWWGPQRIITLAPNNHRSYVAVVRVLD